MVALGHIRISFATNAKTTGQFISEISARGSNEPTASESIEGPLA